MFANPKKAAFLGLLAAVALWFWAPLVWGWIANKAPEAEVAAAQPAGDAAQPMNPQSVNPKPLKSEKPKAPEYPWQELVRWMDDDPRTLPAILLPETRDPFAAAKVVEVPAPVVEKKPEVEEKEYTPAGAGLVLSTTIIGPGTGLARINGKTYEPGGIVRVLKDGQRLEYTLVAVYHRRVVLERKGKQFELKSHIPGQSGHAELTGQEKP